MPTPAQTARLAEAIAADFYGEGLKLPGSAALPDAGTWAGMPEVKAVERLRESGADDREVRLFITFIAAMDRMQKAERLWPRGVVLFQAHPEMFEPAGVLPLSINTIRDRLSSFRVSRFLQEDSDAWKTIARTLATERTPVSGVVESGVGDARDLLRDLRTFAGNRPRFPLLKGEKIGPMWVRMLAAPGGAAIGNIDIIPVQVDVQVRRATRNLGVADPPGKEIDDRITSVIQNAWRDALVSAEIAGPSGIAGTCAALDPALWTLGTDGCSHCEDVRKRIPVSRACESCRFKP